MKTAEEILKKHYDILTGGDTEGWEDFDEDTKSKECMLNAMKEYAQLVAQQALENAAENAGLIWSIAIGPYGGDTMVPEIDKSSITNPYNIPPHYLVGD